MRSRALLLTGLMVATTASADPKQVGNMPVPMIKDLQISTAVSHDIASSVYRYDYSLTSGAANKGNVWAIYFDDLAPTGYMAPRSTAEYTMLRGKNIVPFDRLRDEASYIPGHFSGTLVEVGLDAPPGWMGSVTAGGLVGSFYGGGGKLLVPGSTLKFSFTSPNQPVIKTLIIKPDWELVVDDEGGEALSDEAAETERELLIERPVLAPGPEWPGSREHWDHFKADLAKAAQLGWIKDAGLEQRLAGQLTAARQIFDTQGGAAAIPALRTLLTSIDASTPAQRSDTGFALLELNAQALIAHAADTAASKPSGQSMPRLSLIPEDQDVALGASATVMAQLVDKGNHDAPIVGYPLELRVIGGMDGGKVVKGLTDPSGRLSMTLQNSKPGGDSIELRDRGNMLFAQIRWGGGPNLMIGYFSPPVIHWNGQGKLRVQDMTENAGDVPAGPSVTRYYISSTSPVDPHTARAVGQRPVPALQPGDGRQIETVEIDLPADLPPGTYYMGACADADNQIPEGDERDNCVMQGMNSMPMVPPATH